MTRFSPRISLRRPFFLLSLSLTLLLFMFHAQPKQGLFKDICISDEPYLGLGSALVLQGNLNVTLLNQRIALGTKGSV